MNNLESVLEKKIIIKTPEQIEKIREAGKINALLFEELQSYIKPGISTYQIDKFADRFIKKHGGRATFKSVPGYRHATCISVNNEVVHGIPRKSKIIEKGDIISVDCGVTLNGYIGDSTQTYMMPGVSDVAKKMFDVTKKSLELAIEKAVVGNRIGDIGHVIQEYVESNGFAVVKEYVGHGTGVNLHEEPPIPHYGDPGRGVELKEGMVLAIEPMVNEISDRCRTLKDGWTVVTQDGGLSVQFEHTVAITKNGPMVLTEL